MKILWLGEPACHDITLAGGKAATLSCLAASYPVPPGFCLIASALHDAMEGSVVANESTWPAQSMPPLPAPRAELTAAYQTLVVFSVNPLTGSRDEAVVTASWGMGESIVGGTVTPDTYSVRNADLALVSRQVADKARMTVPGSRGTCEVDVLSAGPAGSRGCPGGATGPSGSLCSPLLDLLELEGHSAPLPRPPSRVESVQAPLGPTDPLALALLASALGRSGDDFGPRLSALSRAGYDWRVSILCRRHNPTGELVPEEATIT
jgi:hypothetical protein